MKNEVTPFKSELKYPSVNYKYNFNFFKIRDLVGYEVFISRMKEWGIDRTPGDFIEIGSFIGGGTVKLASAALGCGKKVFAVDIFEPGCDSTINETGFSMSDIYSMILGGRNQEDIFKETTEGYNNIEVLKVNSKDLKFSRDQKFSFAFLDGNHDPEVVKSDFSLIWPHVSSRGAVGFHDYGGDLPETSKAIDEIVNNFKSDISHIEKIPENWILLVFKK